MALRNSDIDVADQDVTDDITDNADELDVNDITDSTPDLADDNPARLEATYATPDTGATMSWMKRLK